MWVKTCLVQTSWISLKLSKSWFNVIWLFSCSRLDRNRLFDKTPRTEDVVLFKEGRRIAPRNIIDILKMQQAARPTFTFDEPSATSNFSRIFFPSFTLQIFYAAYWHTESQTYEVSNCSVHLFHVKKNCKSVNHFYLVNDSTASCHILCDIKKLYQFMS